MKVIILDLDDTLYEELSFVRGGFLAVANYLKEEYSVDEKKSFNFMEDRERQGRGKIFDELLINFNLYSKKRVAKLISVYRLHTPLIKLHSDAQRFFKRFKSWPLYVLTDGNKVVQARKAEALDLKKFVKKVIITHRYSRDSAKPSSKLFEKVARQENVGFDEVVYIGDDPSKDFVKIKKAGFKTIRILRGNHKDKRLGDEFEAHFEINSLDEITENMLKRLNNG